jgi:hypothetical protein
MEFNNLSKPGISANLLQLVRYKASICKKFDRFGNLSNAMQYEACTTFKLGGKSGID